MPSKAKSRKYKSKWFRIAVEGDTTDGRAIQGEWIDQMAANFNRDKYGARVWLEHIRGILPESSFRAYGDVLAVKAEDVEIDGEIKRGLFAQIDPTEDLVQMNKDRQKIYTSVEIDTDFQKGGEAYLVGLGITDSPASIGTSILEFSAKNPDSSPFSERKQRPENLFTAAAEVTLEFQEVKDDSESLINRVKELFNQKSLKEEARNTNMGKAIEGLAESTVEALEEFSSGLTELADEFSDLKKELNSARDQIQELENKIDHTESPAPRRPSASGGKGAVLTDC